MEKDIEAALGDVAKNRQEIIKRLVEFFETDMLLFWGENEDLIIRQKKLWQPVLDWAEREFGVPLKTTQGIDVPKQEDSAEEKIKAFLDSLNDKQLLAFFKAALDMRSVLLAAALVKGQITAERAFEAAFAEELWQAENWGVVEEAEKRRNELKGELKEIEAFLKNESK